MKKEKILAIFCAILLTSGLICFYYVFVSETYGSPLIIWGIVMIILSFVLLVWLFLFSSSPGPSETLLIINEWDRAFRARTVFLFVALGAALYILYKLGIIN